MRDKAAKALISMGIPMNQSGFLYILDIMELFEEHGAPITNMMAVYEMIARKRGRSISDVMYQIKFSIEFGFKNCQSGAWVNYFGLAYTPKTNGNYLATMWQRLKEEE